ncbi:MAG: PhzF family phenazine biosynthesis protein [Chitinophagaceae bacterium]
MRYTIYQVDAFTDRLFGGNPAAVVPLEKWLGTEQMQQLAVENNLSETVFFVQAGDEDKDAFDYSIRWFTPAVEINLCGHATLASAYVLFNYLGYSGDRIRFNSLSGILTITRNNDIISMDFPAWKPALLNDYPAELSKVLGGVEILSVYQYRDLLVELRDEKAVRECQPDFTQLKALDQKVIITAVGDEADFVSRFFAPSVGVNEDPVTGSAHSQLIPYWAEKLAKNSFHAKQLSKRGGELWCTYEGERVTIAGKCVFYMKGEFELP